jgi:RND family efflux transporter MFP subunit
MTTNKRGNSSLLSSQRRLWVVFAVGAAAVYGLIRLAAFGRIAPGVIKRTSYPLPNQGITRVNEHTVPVTYDLVGTVQSMTPVDAASRVAARVIAVLVRAGQPVRRGAVLVQLDRSDLAAQVAQSAAELDGARAELVKSAADFKRYAELLKRGSVTPHEYDNVAAAYHAAVARLHRASAGLRAAQAALTYATVRAPLDGLVVERLVEPGDMALPGKPLVRLYDQKALRVELEALQSLARKVAVGLPIRIMTDSYGSGFLTRINEIVPAADPRTRSFRLRAAISPEAGLKPGMFVHAELACGMEKILTVPQSAVQIVGQLSTVRVVKDGEIELCPVALGRKFSQQIEVLAGLRAGDQVIASGSTVGRQ